MNIVKGLKTVGTFVKDVLEVVSPVVVTGLLLCKTSKYKPIYSYNDAVVAIMESSMWSDDKAKAVSSLPMYAMPVLYEAVIEVVKSSMFSDYKLNTIIKMCKQYEESH